MKFNDRNYALLGIPDLPINAFRHIGDRKIKPQGGVSSFVDSVTGAVDDAVGSVSNVLADVDDSVNESIPGGWATVAAVAGGAALASGATAGTAAGATAADIAASNALASANLAYAGATPVATATAGAGLLSSGSPFSVPTGQVGANLASQIAQQGATPSLIQQAASFLGVQPSTLSSLAPSAIQGLLSAGGSYLQSQAAADSATTQAQAQVRAAQIAADAARFRPVGVTTRFGSSNFQTDAAGNVIGAGYTPSAEILGYQNRLSALAGQGLTQA